MDWDTTSQAGRPLATALSVLHGYHKQSFANYRTGMVIEKVSSLVPSSEGYGNDSDIDLCTIRQTGENATLVQLRLVTNKETSPGNQMHAL